MGAEIGRSMSSFAFLLPSIHTVHILERYVTVSRVGLSIYSVPTT